MVFESLLKKSLVVYGVYVAVSWMTGLLGNETVLFFWPHLAGLALQDPGANSGLGVVALQAVGALSVGFTATAFRKATRRLDGWGVAVLVVVVALVLTTASFFALAIGLGWQYAA